ncbi:cyclase family protein [Legionella gresilensis]|uniref:cyclase family protein n=1 Tax=Legionella gresilensis TaxID=91823 RepID=UPI0010417CF0|nr:cyclase family protein [Legionella gresilensis]
MLSKSENLSTNNDEPILKKQKKYYDLTANISEKLVTFPGDPRYQAEQVSTLEDGSHFHLNKLSLGNHTGTHIDFPAHVIKGGKTSSDFPIETLIGSGLIIEVPDQEISVTKSLIASHSIMKNDFVFFKTANSKISKNSAFTDKYVYIEPDAAEELLGKGVKIVGIDYISVDKYESEDLPVHKSLLLKDVLIVEGLELKNVPVGRCKIYIMPMKINDMDGLPARVIAKI